MSPIGDDVLNTYHTEGLKMERQVKFKINTTRMTLTQVIYTLNALRRHTLLKNSYLFVLMMS